MKKTSSFLEKLMSYNSSLNLSSYQFMKYQEFCDWTNPNAIPMFCCSQYKGKGIHLINPLKKNGYITGHTQNLCSKESFEYNIKTILGSNLELDEYDHENTAMFCDPIYIDVGSPYPIFFLHYSILRRCLSE